MTVSEATIPLGSGTLDVREACVIITGSSRGIGAEAARVLGARGANVVVTYREKAARAKRIADAITEAGPGRAITTQLDLTNAVDRQRVFETAANEVGTPKVVILNASGGMEIGADADYAMRLNRDAQRHMAEEAMKHLPEGGRIVFVTSHQAHFHPHGQSVPEYQPVAESKRAGESAVRELVPDLHAKGIDLVVISADMIEGTATAMLMERKHPGALQTRREQVGRLWSAAEFGEEVANAASNVIPDGLTILIGDTSDFENTPAN